MSILGISDMVIGMRDPTAATKMLPNRAEVQ